MSEIWDKHISDSEQADKKEIRKKEKKRNVECWITSFNTRLKSDQSAVLLKISGLLSTREARGRLLLLLLPTGCMQEVAIVIFRSLRTI